MSLAARGLGPGRQLSTAGFGPAGLVVLDATVPVGTILLSVTIYNPVAGEVPDLELRLDKVYVGYDSPILPGHDFIIVVSKRSIDEAQMSTANFVYRQDQDSPPIGFKWLDYNLDMIDFTTDHTFSLQLVTYDGIIQKTQLGSGTGGGITGYNVEPNIVVDWDTDFFSDVPVGRYMLHLKATQVSTTKDRYFSLDRLPTLDVIPAPQATP